MNDPETHQLREQVNAGDEGAFARYFDTQRDRLRRAVALRVDPRVRARLDASDVLQDAFLEASHRLGSFLERPDAPVFLWLRFLVLQKLAQAHRRHLKTGKRNAEREVRLALQATPEASSVAMVDRLVADHPSPSQHAMRAEARQRIQEAIDSMSDNDREILALRHFEQLTNAESAEVLGIEVETAKRRYLRALARLGKALEGLDGAL